MKELNHILGLEYLILLEYHFCPNWSIYSLKSPSESQQDFLKNFWIDIDKLVLKFIWKYIGLILGKIILKKKDKVGGLPLPDNKTY